MLVLRWKFPVQVERAKEAINSSLHDLYTVLKNPLRAIELFGGSAAVTLTYLATFVVCAWVVGVNIPVLDLAAVFLAASIIGSASPTPGGLGVLEGAFVAALGVFGVATGQAVAVVLL